MIKFRELYWRFWGWLLEQDAVEIMDFHKQTKYTLVKPVGNKLVGHVYHWSNVGLVVLTRDGLVYEPCPADYLYVWRYLDPQLRVAQVLSFRPQMPSWQEWLAMSHLQMHITRRKLLLGE